MDYQSRTQRLHRASVLSRTVYFPGLSLADLDPLSPIRETLEVREYNERQILDFCSYSTGVLIEYTCERFAKLVLKQTLPPQFGLPVSATISVAEAREAVLRLRLDSVQKSDGSRDLEVPSPSALERSSVFPGTTERLQGALLKAQDELIELRALRSRLEGELATESHRRKCMAEELALAGEELLPRTVPLRNVSQLDSARLVIFRSASDSHFYIHQSGQMRIDNPTAFRLLPPLEKSGDVLTYSLSSPSDGRAFLRHRDYNFYTERKRDSDGIYNRDASFVIRPCPWREGAFVLEAAFVRGYFVRYQPNYEVKLAKNDDSQAFYNSSAFHILCVRKI